MYCAFLFSLCGLNEILRHYLKAERDRALCNATMLLACGTQSELSACNVSWKFNLFVVTVEGSAIEILLMFENYNLNC